MDRVFSVDDMSDHFWPSIHGDGATTTNNQNHDLSTSSSTMNRSSSEWAFQRFLQEAVDATSSSSDEKANGGGAGGCAGGGANTDLGNVKPTAQNIPVDSDEYQEFLKNKLDLACKAVALTRANCVMPLESSAAAPEIISRLPPTVQIGNHNAPTGSRRDLPKKLDKDGVGSTAPLFPAVRKKPCVQVRSTTSGSSGDQSDDDEADCGTIESLGPADAKRMKRMLSNRESARRSRRRKQAHLTELETQASQLRAENSSLLKQLTDVSTKYNEAAVDNRVLKADVETLRAKVKMAEETVKRITGLNPFLQAVSEMSALTPSYSGSASNTSTDADVQVQDDPKKQYYATPSHDMRVHNSLSNIPSEDNAEHPAIASAAAVNKMERTASMPRVLSLEHLQKRIRGETCSGGK